MASNHAHINRRTGHVGPIGSQLYAYMTPGYVKASFGFRCFGFRVNESDVTFSLPLLCSLMV